MDNDRFQNLVLEQLKYLAEGQHELRQDVRRLETRMENEIIGKISALFDDREVQNNRLDNIDQKLDKVLTNTENLAIRATRLEKMAK